MTTMIFGLWLFNLLLDTTGQMAFKTAATEPDQLSSGRAAWTAMLRRPWIWLGVACYCIEFFTWLAFIALMPLSVAVLLSTLNIVAIALAGWLFFGERPTGLRVIGIALVTLGVALVGAG